MKFAGNNAERYGPAIGCKFLVNKKPTKIEKTEELQLIKNMILLVKN